MKEIEQIIFYCTSNRIRCQEREQQFKILLDKEADISFLYNLGLEYFSDTEFTIPIYHRILEIEPDYLDAIIRLIELLWLNGEKEQSQKKLVTAKKIDPENIELMLLEAHLAKSLNTKVQICQKILDRDPKNSDALRLMSHTKSKMRSRG